MPENRLEDVRLNALPQHLHPRGIVVGRERNSVDSFDFGKAKQAQTIRCVDERTGVDLVVAPRNHRNTRFAPVERCETKTVAEGAVAFVVGAEAEIREARIDSVLVVDPVGALPQLWRKLLARLGAKYEPVEDQLRGATAESNTDLADLRRALLQPAVPVRKLELRGDGSVLVMTAFSEFTLAEAAAQTIRALDVPEESATLVASNSAGLVDGALRRQDAACVGIHPPSVARPVPQVLALALRLLWAPLDPRELLEFLAHPVCPMASHLRRRLAEAVAESPGIPLDVRVIPHLGGLIKHRCQQSMEGGYLDGTPDLLANEFAHLRRVDRVKVKDSM